MGSIAAIFLPLALAFIMFSLGLGLTVRDFMRVVVQPRDFMVGALSQVVVLPAVAFILVLIWDPAPELAVGVMIIAAAPGGVTSNLLTRFAGGDTALSVSLTAVISVLAIVTVPVIVFFALDRFVGDAAARDLDLVSVSLQMFAIVAVPVAAGMAVKAFAGRFADAVERPSRVVSGILFAIVLFGAIWQNRANIGTYFAEAGLITLVLNVLMMAIAFWGSMLLNVGRRARIALSLECGLQNGTLALAVAALLALPESFQIPAAIYSLTMFATAIVFMLVVARGRG